MCHQYLPFVAIEIISNSLHSNSSFSLSHTHTHISLTNYLFSSSPDHHPKTIAYKAHQIFKIRDWSLHSKVVILPITNMRLSAFTSFLALAATLISAQSVTYDQNQTAPFQLIIKSHNCTLNGTALSACHQGAGISGLCAFTSGVDASPPSDSTQYVLNYTASTDPNATSGPLVWFLPVYTGPNTTENVPTTMQLTYQIGTNVAIPIFLPGYGGPCYDITTVNFDHDNRMYMVQGLDDTIAPPVYTSKALYRWEVCYTIYSSYYYPTLTWILGAHSAENPTCQKVDVYRVYV